MSLIKPVLDLASWTTSSLYVTKNTRGKKLVVTLIETKRGSITCTLNPTILQSGGFAGIYLGFANRLEENVFDTDGDIGAGEAVRSPAQILKVLV